MSPKAVKPAPEWRRVSAGSHRSADGRFEIEGDGPGRWFVRDTEERDELGLERTIGPFSTLDDAKADAGSRRGRAPEDSPLRKRLERTGSRRDDRPSRPAAPPRQPRPHRQPTWLERLERSDPTGAERAHRLIGALEQLGIADADAVVRRDVDAHEPAVAERLLARSLRSAIASALDGAGTQASDLATARVVLAAVLDVLDAGRAPDASPELPGWRLVEHDRQQDREHAQADGRTLRVDASKAAPERHP